MSTHYATLGLPANATAADIRQAYRQLVKLTHPDRTPDPAAHERYLAVNDAYEVLGNPARRAAYDAALKWRATARPQPATPPPRPAPPRSAGPLGPLQGQARRNPTTARHAPTVRFDLRPYARPIRWAGRALLVFGLLLLLDYGFLYYTTTARVLALDTKSPDSLTVLTTTRGRLTVYGQLPTNLRRMPLQVRSSLVFRFVRAAWLPSGQPLMLQQQGGSLAGFVLFMLPLALLSQWPWLSLAMRLNALMLASATAILILLILLRY